MTYTADGEGDMTNRRNNVSRKGDIVEIEWLDTHSTDRLTQLEIEELDEPWPTVAYGIVLRNGPRYLTIASELCLDSGSDGTWVEQIPHGSVKKVRKLGRRNLEELGE